MLALLVTDKYVYTMHITVCIRASICIMQCIRSLVSKHVMLKFRLKDIGDFISFMLIHTRVFILLIQRRSMAKTTLCQLHKSASFQTRNFLHLPQEHTVHCHNFICKIFLLMISSPFIHKSFSHESLQSK